MPAILKNGNLSCPGGKRKNAGRLPDWLKGRCQKIIDKKKLIDFLGNVASGANMEQVVTDTGETVKVPAAVRDRLRAVEMLLDRGYGKADAKLTVDAGDGFFETLEACIRRGDAVSKS